MHTPTELGKPVVVMEVLPLGHVGSPPPVAHISKQTSLPAQISPRWHDVVVDEGVQPPPSPIEPAVWHTWPSIAVPAPPQGL
ncbi:MAG: hypothetical protein JNK82_33530 [Myxococcaceae bacterium]|nr:hypothetical protein [Myxococcaceae bacterium]